MDTIDHLLLRLANLGMLRWRHAGAEATKRVLREARGRTDAMIALAEEGPAGLLQTLDALLPAMTVPGTCSADCPSHPGEIASCV